MFWRGYLNPLDMNHSGRRRTEGLGKICDLCGRDDRMAEVNGLDLPHQKLQGDGRAYCPCAS